MENGVKEKTDRTEVQGPGRRPGVLDLFDAATRDGRPLHVAAPMVRYSKLPFRLLIRDYGVDVTYTPMMLAHEFIRSHFSRDSDFTTHPLEQEPTADGKGHVVIAQFASSDPTEFARAAEMITPFCSGVDLNCGCPQSWAIKEGIGCSLMSQPELVASMVTAAKARIAPDKSVSVKIRIHKDINETIRWVQIVQKSGIDYITVHGRLKSQRSSTPPNYEAIRVLREHIHIPLLANGDAYTYADVLKIAHDTGADGVMAARGILENPALFAQHTEVPVECLRDFLAWAIRCPIPFALVLHHVTEMTARMPGMTKRERKAMMQCADLLDLLDFVEERWPTLDEENATGGVQVAGLTAQETACG